MCDLMDCKDCSCLCKEYALDKDVGWLMNEYGR